MTSDQAKSPVQRGGAALAASAVLFAGAGVLLGAGTGGASSHKEAPLILNDGEVDHTDLYAFVSPDRPDTVTFVSNVSPFQDPAGGPNFYPFAKDARYNINVDNDGDAVADVTYRWTFQTQDGRGAVDYPGTEADGTFLYNNGPVNSINDPTLLFKQTYTLEKITADGESEVVLEGVPVAPSNVGNGSMPNYAALRDEALADIPGGGKVFAGQADDPFFIDLRVFDLLYGGNLSERGNQTTAGKNVNAMVLQVPIAEITAGDPVIGIWATAERPSMRVQSAAGTQEYSGEFVQVSRLGNPLVNEVVIPANLKDAFNALAPRNDASAQPAVDRVLDPEVPKLLEAVYDLPAKATPRNDLFTIFLTGLKGLNQPAGTVQPAELLRLNTSIAPTAEPNRLGVLAGDTQGFPNGRRLTDDVVDIGLQALAGAVSVDAAGAPTGVAIVPALAEGDLVNRNDVGFGRAFPYVALPVPGSQPNANDGASRSGGGSVPSGGMDAGQAPVGGSDSGTTVPLVAAGAAGLALVLGGYGLVARRRVRALTSR